MYRPKGWGQPVKARSLARPWAGLDTERDSADGRFACGWTVGDLGEQRFERLTDLAPGTYWVWNIGYDLEGMIRDLGAEEGWAARRDGARFPFMGGTAIYYHGKRFDWRGGDGARVFLEASSFFGRVPLKKIGAKAGLNAAKMSVDRYRDGSAVVEPEDVEPGAEHLVGMPYGEAVDLYCQQDARIVYDAVTDLDMGVRALGVELGATPGATARRFLNRMGGYPDVIWRTHSAFLKSYCGGRFEITKRGILHDVRQYDIVSAYPWALSECPWLTETAYHRRSRRLSDDALYGSYEVSFKFDDYLGIAPRWREGVRVYSAEQGRTWLTRPEVDWLRERGANLEIHRAVEIFDENATDLWREIITELFAMKQENKGQPEGMGAKIVLNSQYGVLIQLVRKSGKWVELEKAQNPIDFAGNLALEEPPKAFDGGKFYAPVYAGNLTALTRIKLLDAARSVGPEHFIGGHTDSVLATTDLKVGLGDRLGDWQLEKHVARADIAKTGMYAMSEWDFGQMGALGSSVKMRGITRDGTAATLWAKQHERRQRVGIKRAKRFEDVSIIRSAPVANNYAVERKRDWEGGDIDRALRRMEYIDSEAWRRV